MHETNTPIVLRDARNDERDAIRDLTLEAYGQYETVMSPTAWPPLRSALMNAINTMLPAERIVAERGGRLVGSVMLFPPSVATYGEMSGQFDFPELRLLSVSPAVRGLGIGRMLVEECIRRAKRAGAQTLGLHSSDSMAVAIRLYEQMGFVRAPKFDFQPDGAELVKGYQLNLTNLSA